MSGVFRILVVDDNRSLAEALADVFEGKGYEATVAFDGVQALEKVRQHRYDCILMDIRMPRLSGVDAFREIKKVDPAVPVILMTAYSVQGLIEEARAEGALAILQKPVAMKKILGIVDELRGSSSLLITDVDPDATLVQTLTEHGARVVVAPNVREAITAAASGDYDAVLLNAEIHGLSSADNIALFKRCDPKCLIILMSGEPAEDYGPFVFAALQKPFKMQEVVSLLEKVRAHKVHEKLGDKLFEV